MNTDTGAIAAFENLKDAKAAGHDLPLTDGQAAGLLRMSRPDRVALVRAIRKRRKASRKRANKARRENRK